MPWSTRVQRAWRRFILYARVEATIAQERRVGANTPEIVWKRPVAEMRLLKQTGGQILRALAHTQPVHMAHEQIECLEGVVDQLAAADDWARRLHPFLRDLRTERARRALTSLVRRGCVPHEIVRCIRTFADERKTDASRERRQETLAYLPKLKDLAAAFVQLADDCDAYQRLPEQWAGSTFRLDRHAAAFLRDEAAVMSEFIRDADPRRRVMFTMANADLMNMMRDIKTITGTFQELLIAELLNGVPGIRMSIDRLKQLRTRHTRLGKVWTTPRYLTRPTSRIVMDSQSPVDDV